MAIAHRSGAVSDRALHRLVTALAVGLVGLLAAFTVLYYLGQHTNAGPSLTERQVTSAEAAVKATPNDLSARLKLAAAYRENKQYSDAVTQYDELLRINAGDRNTLVGKGETQIAMGDLTGAVTTLTKVTTATMTWSYEALDPQLEKAFYDLGSVYALQGDQKNAISNLQSALKIDSTDADALYALGTSLLATGKPADAAQNLQQAVSFVPTGWKEPYTALEQAYTQLKQPDRATYAAAMAAFCDNDLDAASTRLTALTSGSVKDDAMLGLAFISEKKADDAAALSWYRKVLKDRPADFSAKSGVDRLTASTSAAGATPTTGVK
jgi:tetratricopeptide (TPR) repeat protein